ncbi:MAG: ASCH domain-containing protein [Candidatus Aenigmatarchaeota archaeon]
MKTHLAILYKKYLDLILSGKKTIESRFSKIRSVPYGKVESGDRIIFKESSGPVRGEASVEKVEYFDNVDIEGVKKIINKYGDDLQLEHDFSNEEEIDTNYITLIFLNNVENIEPYEIKKKDPRPWVVMDGKLQDEFEIKP